MSDAEAAIRAVVGDREDWLEYAVRILTAHVNRGRRVVDISTVGGRICWARECAGMTQKQMALRLSVSQRLVCFWERGEVDIALTKLQGVAVCLGVSARWLAMSSDDGGPKGPSVILRKEKTGRFEKYKRSQEKYAEAQEKARILNNLRPRRKAKS